MGRVFHHAIGVAIVAGTVIAATASIHAQLGNILKPLDSFDPGNLVPGGGMHPPVSIDPQDPLHPTISIDPQHPLPSPPVSIDPQDPLHPTISIDPQHPFKPVCLGWKQCEELMPKLPDLNDLCNKAFEIAQRTEREVNGTRRRVWAQIRNAASKFGSKDAKVLLFDLNSQASFTYNAYAKTAWYKITLPKGMNLEKDKVEASFSIPNMEVKDLITETGFLKTSLRDGYDTWAQSQKNAHPNRYVYVASKRFVDAIAIERITQEVGWAIVTYGSTAEGSLEALEELLALEWADLLHWLEELNLGKQISAKAASELVKAVRDTARNKGLERAQVHLPSIGSLPKLTLEIEWVNYQYKVDAAVTSEENRRILSFIGINTDKPVAKLVDISLPHLAFSISITKPPTDKVADYLKRFSNFGDVLEQQGSAVDIDELARVGDVNLDKGHKAAADGRIQAMFSRALPKELADVVKYHEGGGIFNFTNSKGAQELEKILTRALTIGNARNAKVKRLIVDVSSGSISLDVELTSKEEWTRDDVWKAGEKFWAKTEDQQSALFNKARNGAKKVCDDLGQKCQSLLPDQLKASAKVCGSHTRYQTLALPLLPPSVPTECDRLAGDPDDPDRDRYAGEVQKFIIGDDAGKEALKVCLEQVARTPSVARFHYQLGRSYKALNQHEEARAHFEMAAKLGHEQAMFMLYDPSTADPTDFKWLQRSANLGNPIAMVSIGRLYAGYGEYKDLGITPDHDQARSWLERAIEAGSSDAALTLFYVYKDGKEYGSTQLIEKNAAEAAKYMLTYIKLGGTYLAHRPARPDDAFFNPWRAPVGDKLDKPVVREIQLILIRDNYLIGTADGVFGAKTEKALAGWILAKGSTAPVTAALPRNDRAVRPGCGEPPLQPVGGGGGDWGVRAC